MKMKILKNNNDVLQNTTTEKQRFLSINGGTLIGPLILQGNPNLPLEAATRQYVDTLIALRAPLAHTHTLSNITDYPPHVTPALLNNLVGTTGNIQTQINNRLPLSGGKLTGTLTLSANPVTNLEAATKQYVDSLIPGEGSSIPTGVIVAYGSSVTPAGFLRCNGAAVDRTTFANLFTVIGTEYSTPLFIGHGKPWIHQYNINNRANSIISGWSVKGTLTSIRGRAKAFIINDRIYLIGGNNGATILSSIERINLDSVGEIINTSLYSVSLPVALTDFELIQINNFIYIFGGRTTGNTAVSTIYRATVDADGELSTFTLIGNLPTVLAAFSACVIGNRLYIIGGNTGSTTISVTRWTSIFSDGSLSLSWTTGPSLPATREAFAIFIFDNVLIVAGGNSGTTAQNTVNYSNVNLDNSINSFVARTPNIPASNRWSGYLTTKNNVYIIGGNTTADLNTVITGIFNSSTQTVTWSTSNAQTLSNLPVATSEASIVVGNNYVYCIGGRVSSNILAAIFRGGSNNYSRYTTEILSTQFRLPNIVSNSGNDPVWYYIKT